MHQVPHNNAYFRARIDVYREQIAASTANDPDLVLLCNGVMREKYQEENLVIEKLANKDYPNTPLVLSELCQFNTWFSMHSEKVCGEEVITTSREFPLSIKGDRSWIENTIHHAIGEDRLILPVPFEWTLKYFDPSDEDFDVEYSNGQYVARIYQGGIDYNLRITEGDTVIENSNHRHIGPANFALMHFMKAHRGISSSKTLELEALAQQLEQKLTTL